jgi:PhnB protein
MAASRPDDSPQVIPYLYYHDATKALDFLVKAFGFEVKSAYRDDNGDVLTAQLRTGDGLVMIGSGMEGFGTRGVDDPDWATTRMFGYVDDVDAHYERAKAAGVRIVSEPEVHFSNNKIYVAGDCGGQQWIFAQPSDSVGESDSMGEEQ